jgi:hypothetical protein
MRQLIGFVLAAVFLGGCAVYADPSGFRASAGFYANPAPVVVAPAYRARGWQYDRYEARHDGWRRG